MRWNGPESPRSSLNGRYLNQFLSTVKTGVEGTEKENYTKPAQVWKKERKKE